MFLATTPLPQDFAALQAFAAALQERCADLEGAVEAHAVTIQECQTEIAVYKDDLYAKTLHIEKLKAQLAAMRRARFGQSSEKLESQIDQMELMLGELEESLAEDTVKQQRAAATEAASSSTVTPATPRQKPVRKPLPAHLPRERVEYAAACTCPQCGSTRLTRIGTDEREVLEYVPAHFKAVVHVRPKMACRDCETIAQEPMPSLPIVKGLPGSGLLAHVLVAKYCDHLPLYRQEAIYAREGLDLDRSTLAGWVGTMSALLAPLAEAIARHVKAGHTFHTDDTPVSVLEPGRGKTRTGRLWVLGRDERPFGSDVPPAVCYLYSQDRKAEHAEALLAGCKGFLHADGYNGFDRLYKVDAKKGIPQRFTEVACWAHARRKIFDVHVATKSPAAQSLLEQFGKLFEIERTISGKPPAHRLTVRKEQSIPLLQSLKAEMEATLNKISRKSALASAIHYSLHAWDALTVYTTDGRLEMTNNAAERAMRPIALGRKNSHDRLSSIYAIVFQPMFSHAVVRA